MPVDFKSDPEDKLLLRVEMRVRNQHRTAQRSAGIKEPERWPGRAIVFREPVVGVHGAVAEVGVEAAMELRAAGLAHGVDHDRSLGLVGAEIRGRHLHFLHLVHVDVGHRPAHVAGVDQVGAIGLEVDQALLRSRAARAPGTKPSVSRADHLVAIQPARPLVLHVGAGVEGKPGQNGDQFASVAADGRQTVEIVGGDQRAMLPGILCDSGLFGAHRDGNLRFAYLQRDLGHGEAVAGMDHDAGYGPGFKT